MISRALNLSDRLSSCSKVARRLLGDKASLFHLFVFQPGMDGAEEEEADEFLIRFNLNGIELNDEGFAKLSEEIALQTVEAECEMPWGREPTTFSSAERPWARAWNRFCCAADSSAKCYPMDASVPPARVPTTKSAPTPNSLSWSKPCWWPPPATRANLVSPPAALHNSPGGARGLVILPNFKLGDPSLRGRDGGFDSHSLPPKSC